MSPGAVVWGTHWLGEPGLWEGLENQMTARWGKGDVPADIERGSAPADRYSPGALRAVMAAAMRASDQARRASTFICQAPCGPAGMGPDLFEPVLLEPALLEPALLEPVLLEPVDVLSNGAAGGLDLVACAQERLAKGAARAICLAISRASNEAPAGARGKGESAAALGLGIGLDKGLCRLGPVGSGQYSGVPDSGAQTDFIERVGLQAKGERREAISTVILNKPRAVKWQAALDAAARRLAPLGRRYALPVDRARQAGGLMMIMAGLAAAAPKPQSPRLVLAVDQAGRAAAVQVWPL